MVASTNTPSLPPLAQVQPSPSSHGVARPAALSGLAGTDTVQLVELAASAVVWVKLKAFPAASTAFDPAAPARPGGLMGGMPMATVVVAAAVPEAEAEADGQGAVLALALAAGAGALALAAATAAGAGALALAAVAGALAAAEAEAEAHVPRADCATVVAVPPWETTMTTPNVRPSAAGMARGTANRDARLLRRRGADPCSLSIFDPPPCGRPLVTLPVHHRRTCASAEVSKFLIIASCKGFLSFGSKMT